MCVERIVALAGLTALEDQLLHQIHVDGVETAERLVEHTQIRLAQERACDLNLLAHSLAQGLHVLTRDVRHADLVQPSLGGLACFARTKPLQPAEVHERIDDLGLLVETAFFGQVRDAVERVAMERLAEQRDATFVGSEDVEPDSDQRRLPGAVWSEQPEDLAVADVERDGGQRTGAPKRLSHFFVYEYGLAHVFDFVRARRVRSSRNRLATP